LCCRKIYYPIWLGEKPARCDCDQNDRGEHSRALSLEIFTNKENCMATSQKKGTKSRANAGLKMVGGAAAGAAAGSLIGPLGAAVGAVVGGIAGANADEIAESRPVKRLASATKSTVARRFNTKAVKNAVAKMPVARTLTRKTSAKAGATKKKPTRKK
jgi:hypothetical protein